MLMVLHDVEPLKSQIHRASEFRKVIGSGIALASLVIGASITFLILSGTPFRNDGKSAPLSMKYLYLSIAGLPTLTIFVYWIWVSTQYFRFSYMSIFTLFL